MISLVIGLLVDKSEIDTFKDTFMEIDKDNNGYLDKEEFA